MYRLVYNIAPNIFKNAGPNCVTQGRCPEGNMTCGKMKEMEAKFETIKNNIVANSI
jgi:thymidylate synthase (FAD)